jgi:hypothetical protein
MLTSSDGEDRLFWRLARRVVLVTVALIALGFFKNGCGFAN